MTNKRKQLKQVQNQAQDGRSMVEMLGVLAIIGVLSLGGIAGYRMAMNHYQANQIAHEINMMRTDAKVKIAQGMPKLLLGSPYDGNGHLNFNANYGVQVDFPVTITDETGENEEDGYSFTLSGIPAGVCKPLATLLNGMDDTAFLEINGDDEAAGNECSKEKNKIEVAFSAENFGVSGGGKEDAPKCNETTCPGGTCNEDGVCECPGDKHWTGTDCITCSTEAPWSETEKDCVCTDGKYLYGNRCITCDTSTGGTWDETTKKCKCDEGLYWIDSAGACLDNPCNEGRGCPVNQFCQSSSCTSCNESSCTKFDCVKIDTNTSIVKGTVDGKKFYGSKNSMNWWSAKRFCKAAASQAGGSGYMVSWGDIDWKCYQDDDAPNPTSKKSGYCKGTSASSGSNNVSETIKDLREMYCGSGKKESSCSYYPWLKDEYSSCDAYTVFLDYAIVTYGGRGTNRPHALCQ